MRGLLKAAVDKMRSFCFVFVYFEVRAGAFESSGRQNTVILLRFCLLLVPRGAFLGSVVDKMRSFCSVFVYFEVHAEDF